MATKPVWLARLHSGGSDGHSYEILEKDTPRIFAPQPIYNTLQHRTVTPCSYSSDAQIRPHDANTPGTIFTNIDVDIWARQFLAAFDNLLSPANKPLVKLVGQMAETPQNFLSRLQDTKERLADSISKLMIQVYHNEPAGGESDAQETFRQAMLEELGNAYATAAAVQFTAKRNAHAGENAPVLITFLLAAEGKTDGDVTSFIPLKDVTFMGTNVGSQIGKPPGVKKGYTAPSWLNCLLLCLRGSKAVAPRDSKQTSLGNRPPVPSSLGTFEVPVVLRTFPTQLLLVDQDSPQSRVYEPGSPVNLNELTRYDYSFSYSNDYHDPQDRACFEVKFNVKDQDVIETAVDQSVMETEVGQPDLVQSLAQFVTLFPAIDADLVWTHPESQAKCEPQDSKNAAALEAFATIAECIAHAWELATPSLATPGSTSNVAGAYVFHVTESAQETGNDNSPLVITLRECVVRPERIGPPVVCIRGYDTKVERVPALPPLPAEFKYSFSKAGTPLTAKEGMQIAHRQVCLPDMLPLERQNVFLQAYRIRNKELVPGKLLAEEFVYRTTSVRFANPLPPLVDLSTKLDVACVGAITPQTRSLAHQLANMFENLFEFAPQMDDFQVMLNCSYEYQIEPDLPDVSLPILMLPPTDFAMSTDTKVPEAGCVAGEKVSLVCNIANAVSNWFDQAEPNSLAGTLRFDLSVFSAITPQPMPILRLRNLRLSLDHLSAQPTLKDSG